MANTPGQDPKHEGSFKDKISETLEQIKKNEKIEDLYKYAQSNTVDTIAYVAMILGILIQPFQPFYGGLLIGVIAGLYFSKIIMKPLRSIEDFIEQTGIVKSLILLGLTIGLLYNAPWIFIGGAIAVLIKEFLRPRDKDE